MKNQTKKNLEHIIELTEKIMVSKEAQIHLFKTKADEAEERIIEKNTHLAHLSALIQAAISGAEELVPISEENEGHYKAFLTLIARDLATIIKV